MDKLLFIGEDGVGKNDPNQGAAFSVETSPAKFEVSIFKQYALRTAK